MWSDKCKIDQTINDFYIFCWNTGCNVGGMVDNTESNFLYMTRAIINAAIVWWEGVPESKVENREQWHKLSGQSGETISNIIKDFTDFKPQKKFNDNNY